MFKARLNVSASPNPLSERRSRPSKQRTVERAEAQEQRSSGHDRAVSRSEAGDLWRQVPRGPSRARQSEYASKVSVRSRGLTAPLTQGGGASAGGYWRRTHLEDLPKFIT